MTKAQLDENVSGYIKTDLKEGGRVGIVSFEEFCRNQLPEPAGRNRGSDPPDPTFSKFGSR